MSRRKIAGRTVLITGASSGIGKVAARLFADNGFHVFGTALPASPAEYSQGNPDFHGIEVLWLDVRSDDSVRSCVDEVLTRAGRIDVLINNAGTMHLGFAEETAMAEARSVFETNFFGVVRMVNAVLPSMRRRRQGCIINIGSLAAWVGEPNEAFYSASKHALAGYTEALHHEVWPFGVRVCLVEPAAFRTGIVEAASVTSGSIADYDPARQSVADVLRTSLRRGSDPRQMSRLLLRIVNSRSPRFRYPAGREAHWLPYLKLLLPQRLFDYILHRAYRLRKETRPSARMPAER
jgi:NAD(P)-dependent dehydrogenase (short-subunit alcohol dehydrogenase family)